MGRRLAQVCVMMMVIIIINIIIIFTVFYILQFYLFPFKVAAGATALVSSTILACVWPEQYTDSVYILGLARRAPYYLPVYIWLYNIAVWFFQDACKVWAYRIVFANNWFGVNDSTDKGGLITGECCGIGGNSDGEGEQTENSNITRNVFEEAYQQQLQAELEESNNNNQHKYKIGTNSNNNDDAIKSIL